VVRPRSGRRQRFADPADVVTDDPVPADQGRREFRPHPAVSDTRVDEGEGRTRAFVVKRDPGSGPSAPGE
jgi:hypothetical protein